MKCRHCQAENPAGMKFCGQCAAPLPSTCPSCGAANPSDNKFCGQCATPLGAPAQQRFGSPESYTPRHLAEKILTSRSALEGERKQVTVLFADVANSTALAERLGPEAMHGLLSKFFELALAEVHRYEGTVNQFLGDGFMALFGAPFAYEDHARRAVLAAWGIQRSLRQQRPGFAPGADIELAVRMGLNTGAVVVGKIGDNLRMDYTAVGDTTNLAARLQQAAEPGAILIGEATHRLVRAFVRVETIEPLHVKGKTGAVTAHRVLDLRPRRSPLDALGERSLSEFVGRGRELAVLGSLLEQVESGQGQVVGVVGEPGGGKSRLLYEFRRNLTGRRITYLEGRCLSYGSSIPYLPVLDQLRSNFGITDLDPPEVAAAKVRFGLQEVGTDPDEGAPYLLHVLGIKPEGDPLAVLTPEAIKSRTFEAIRQLSLEGSRKRPLLLAVEDLHWIDKTSEEYFATLVESLPGVPILLLATYRPGYRPPWMEKSYATQLALRPLASQESLAVVQSVVPEERIPDPVARVILDKAEGNPFFLEELTRAVAEHGDLAIPDTVQGVLSARIDRLADEPKRLLQTASVLGREAPRALLEAIWEGPGDFEPHLAALKRLEFLYEQPGAGEPVYVFKHVLTQEVAYEALLTPLRQALHAAAGRALETLFAGRVEAVYDRLAYHYSKTAEANKAVEYLTRVAEKAAGMYAHAEAVTALTEAIVHAERLPVEDGDRRLLDLAIRQAESLHFLGRRQEIVDLLLGRQDRLQRVQDASLASRYYLWLGHAYTFLGNREQAAPSLQRALDAATRQGDDAAAGRARYALAMESWGAGHPEGTVVHAREAVSLLERTGDRFWLGWSLYALSFGYFFVGDFDMALHAAARLEGLGDAVGDRRLHALGALMTGRTLTLKSEGQAGVDACRRALDLSPDPFETALIRCWLGQAYFETGDLAQAIPVLEEAVGEAKQYRSPQVQGWFMAVLGDAYLANGQTAEARELIARGLEVSTSARYLLGMGLAQRALGRLARAEGALAEAERHFSEARQTFTSAHSRFEVARTHLDLAALSHARGDRDATGAHLNAAHSVFRQLRVPKYVERTARLATDFDVAPPEEAGS